MNFRNILIKLNKIRHFKIDNNINNSFKINKFNNNRTMKIFKINK
jgi:hypothetical protein